MDSNIIQGVLLILVRVVLMLMALSLLTMVSLPMFRSTHRESPQFVIHPHSSTMRDPRLRQSNNASHQNWEIVDSNVDSESGDLVLFAVGRQRFLIMKDPHGKGEYYNLRVPDSMNDAREAHAWTFSLTKEEYLNLRKQT